MRAPRLLLRMPRGHAFCRVAALWLACALTTEASPVTGIVLTNAAGDPGTHPLADPDILTASLRPFLGQENTSATRGAVADAVLSHYQAAGRPVTEVEVIARGVDGMEVAVTEGRYGGIAVEGGTAWMRQAVASGWRSRPGALLTLPDVLDGLDWTHRNPLHAVTAAFGPGAEPATADTTLTLQSDTPVRLFSAWRNNGIQPLGKDRFSAGFEVTDLFGLPFWMSVEGTTGDDPDTFLGGRAQLRTFLPWRHEFRLSGVWTEGRTAGPVPGFTSSSGITAWFLSSRYVVPLPAGRGWRSDAGAGIDFFRTSSTVTVAGLRAAGTADALHATLEFQATRRSGPDSTGILAEAAWSPGGISQDAVDTAHHALRAGASADYFLTRLQAWHHAELACRWGFTLQSGAQWTSQPVLPVQAFSPAGSRAVRGYPEASVLGDRGIWGGLEIQTPEVALPIFSAPVALRVLSFLEGGTAGNEVSGNSSSLAGAGTGIRLRWGRHALFACDYGWRLTEPGSQVHLSAGFEF